MAERRGIRGGGIGCTQMHVWFAPCSTLYFGFAASSWYLCVQTQSPLRMMKRNVAQAQVKKPDADQSCHGVSRFGLAVRR